MFFRKKTLAESDPKSLNIEALSLLQASLIAKLIMVNDELQRRFRLVTDLSSEIKDTEDSREILSEGTREIAGFNDYLRDKLAKLLGKKPN